MARISRANLNQPCRDSGIPRVSQPAGPLVLAKCFDRHIDSNTTVDNDYIIQIDTKSPRVPATRLLAVVDTTIGVSEPAPFQRGAAVRLGRSSHDAQVFDGCVCSFGSYWPRRRPRLLQGRVD